MAAVSSSLSSCFCLIILHTLFSNTHSTSPNATNIPALFAFGDSLHDPGNNNHLPTLLKSNFPPYGRDLAGRTATGRFSNGKISPDLFASHLGLKELLPAYLDPELKPQDLLTGVSFASAGTGYDTLTAKTLSVLSMGDQLDLFREYKEKLKLIAGEERVLRIVAEGLYIISGGSNDVLVTYFDTTLRRWHYDVASYVDLLVQLASSFLKELYSLGARKITVAGLPPLGCLPFQRTFKGGLKRNCAVSANQAAILYNSKLRKELESLTAQLHGSSISYLNLFDAVNAVIQHPASYGFVESTRGCCGTGKIELSILCNKASPYTCPNASKYVFWDSFHPTERLIEIVVAQLFNNNLPLIL